MDEEGITQAQEFNNNFSDDENRLIPKTTIQNKLEELEMTTEEYQIYLLYKILKRLETICNLIEKR